MSKIVAYKLVSGEFIIGDKTDQNDIVLQDACVFQNIPHPDDPNAVIVGIKPAYPMQDFGTGSIELKKSSIMFKMPVEPKLQTLYSGITGRKDIIPAGPKIIVNDFLKKKTN